MQEINTSHTCLLIKYDCSDYVLYVTIPYNKQYNIYSSS